MKEMKNKKLIEFISYLKFHPEAYVEMVTGKKLPMYQRLIIKVLNKINRREHENYIKFKNESIIYCSSKNNVTRSNRSELISFYCKGCKETHENYKLNNVQFIGEHYQMCKESYDQLLKTSINEK